MQNLTNPITLLPKQYSTYKPIESPFNVQNNSQHQSLGLVPCSKVTGNNLFQRHLNGVSCWALMGGNDTKWLNQYDHDISCYNASLKLNQFTGSNQPNPTNNVSQFHTMALTGNNKGESAGQITISGHDAKVGVSTVNISGNEFEASCSGRACNPTYNQALPSQSTAPRSVRSAYCGNTYGGRMRSIYDSNF